MDATSVLKTLATFSNVDAGSSYVERTYDLSQFGGQTIQIEFTATEDPAKATSFVIDDVALNSAP